MSFKSKDRFGRVDGSGARFALMPRGALTALAVAHTATPSQHLPKQAYPPLNG